MYIQRKISKLKSKVILPPTPEEILKDDFNYKNYVQKALNLEINLDEVQALYNNLKPSITKKQYSNELYQTFEKQIIEIQQIYENDLKNNKTTIDYNKEMKKIAKAYIKAYNFLPNSKPQKLITDKSKEEKEKIESTSSFRIKKFNQDKLPIEKLYICDLKNVPATGISKRKKMILYALRDKIVSEYDLITPYETLKQLKQRGKK